MEKTKRGGASHYSCMSTDEICSLPVQQIAAPDSILALWCPSAMLADGLKVMAAWGFKQKTVWTWAKLTKTGKLAFGMGSFYRGCTEHVLIGARGKPNRLSASERNLSLSLALPHSRKPECLQDSLERMYSGPYLELFARRVRKGWVCLGNEIDGRDLRHVLKEWASVKGESGD